MGIKKVARNFLRFKTIKSVKTTATPRPIVDSGISVVSMVTMVFYTIAGRSWYQRGRINKGRSPQNCIEHGWVSVRPSDAILRDDELISFTHYGINKHVTPRRGTHGGGECVELICPDVGVFRCLYFVAERLYYVAGRDVASEGVSGAVRCNSSR